MSKYINKTEKINPFKGNNDFLYDSCNIFYKIIDEKLSTLEKYKK